MAPAPPALLVAGSLMARVVGSDDWGVWALPNETGAQRLVAGGLPVALDLALVSTSSPGPGLTHPTRRMEKIKGDASLYSTESLPGSPEPH